MNKQDELLEYLRIQTNSLYISDLKNCRKYSSIKKALSNLNAAQYSVQEWNDAVSYITSQAVSFSKAEEAAEYLKKYSNARENRLFYTMHI